MTGGDVRYRWIDGPTASQQDWDRIEDLLAARGWISLARATSRILVAEDVDGHLLGFHVFQLIPYCGPLYVVPTRRASGLAADLADRMVEFLAEVHARGWIVTAESPFAAELCEQRGMTKIETPVYVMGDPGGVTL